jgi:pimeloyl-ACP methyl ester carboxylesterase
MPGDGVSDPLTRHHAVEYYAAAAWMDASWRARLPSARQEVLLGCSHFPMLDDPSAFERVLRAAIDAGQ